LTGQGKLEKVRELDWLEKVVGNPGSQKKVMKITVSVISIG